MKPGVPDNLGASVCRLLTVVSSGRPTSPLVLRCRWHTGAWGPCSATCGVGIQTRDVRCLHRGEPPAPAEGCAEEKPHALQACNQFDCPPGWHIEEWQQVRPPADAPAPQAHQGESPALTPPPPPRSCVPSAPGPAVGALRTGGSPAGSC